MIVDKNGLQGFGSVLDIAGQTNITELFRSFGIHAADVPGHDPFALHRGLSECEGGVRAVIARTHKGNGVGFMRDRMEWHYLPMSQALYEQAVRSVWDEEWQEVRAA